MRGVKINSPIKTRLLRGKRSKLMIKGRKYMTKISIVEEKEHFHKALLHPSLSPPLHRCLCVVAQSVCGV